MSLKRWWSSTLRPVSPPSLPWATGRGCAEVEIAALRLDQCTINQRVGSITLVDAKGGKTRTLDLHNMARRALFDYLSPAEPQDDDRDPESVYVFTSQRAAGLRQQGRSDHLSERGIEHLWGQFKRQGSYEEWKLIADVTFHDLRHDFAHRARQAGWSLEEIAVYAGHQTKDGAPVLRFSVVDNLDFSPRRLTVHIDSAYPSLL